MKYRRCILILRSIEVELDIMSGKEARVAGGGGTGDEKRLERKDKRSHVGNF